MITKTITWTNFLGEEETREFCFHLSKAKVIEDMLVLGEEPDDFKARLEKIVAGGNKADIIKTFKDILFRSVGVRSEDGKRFIQNQETTDDFVQSGAYDEFFMWMFTDAFNAAKFIEGLLPKDLIEAAKEKGVENIDILKPDPKEGQPKASVTTDLRPAWIIEDRPPTKKEMVEMTREQFQEVFVRDQAKLALANQAQQALGNRK